MTHSKCMGCGADKDLDQLEVYPYAEDRLVSTPICPIMVIECSGAKWRAALVCHGCFHRLDVDMWISDRCWASINPAVPFNRLPTLKESGGDERWDPRSYADTGVIP